MTIRRRNFLSMMAAGPFTVSMAGLLDGCASENPSQSSTFYVWTHGIFGISWTKPTSGTKLPGIRLICPNLTAHSGGAHVYSVGRVTAKGSDMVSLKKTGSYKKEYRFDGLKSSCSEKEVSPLPTSGLPPLNGTLKDDYDGYSYQLPCPSRIISLRGFYSKMSCSTAGNKIPQQPLRLPMVHVFAYENVMPESVQVISVDTNTAVWKGRKSNHLHLFVEPSDITIEKPDYTAPLKALLNCYNKIEDISIEQREPCLRLDNVLGFCEDLREQFYLYEWNGKSPCSIGKAGNGAEDTFRPQGCPQFWVVEP